MILNLPESSIRENHSRCPLLQCQRFFVFLLIPHSAIESFRRHTAGGTKLLANPAAVAEQRIDLHVPGLSLGRKGQRDAAGLEAELAAFARRDA